MFSLMDLFLPRSSWRPSPFLLQDAHPSSVYRSLHLQAPAAASVVPGTTPHPTPAQPKIKHHPHTGPPPQLSPVTWGLPTCCTVTPLILALEWTDSEKALSKTELSSDRHSDVELILCCESKDCGCEAAEESLWIKAVCSLASPRRKKQHYTHKHIYITWRCAMACIIVILSSRWIVII